MNCCILYDAAQTHARKLSGEEAHLATRSRQITFRVCKNFGGGQSPGLPDPGCDLGDDHPTLPIVRCSSRTPGHLTYTSQPKNSLTKALSISGRISSQPAAFPVFSILTARETSAALRVFFHPKCTSCVFGGVTVTGFKRFLKYSLHLPRMSFSLLRKAPFWFSMDLVV